MIPVTIQIASFLLVIVIGILLGVLFDSYRILRNFWQPKRIGTILGDIVFCFFITIFVFTLLIIGNWGEIRGYVFIAIILGLVLYYKFLSDKAKKIIFRIFKIIIFLLKKIWVIITWPFKVIYKILMVPVCLIGTSLWQGIRLLKKITKSLKAFKSKIIRIIIYLKKNNTQPPSNDT